MNIDQQADCFKALGDPTRLRILQFLAQCPTDVELGEDGQVRKVDGPTVGEVCCQLFGPEISRSNISFHLKELRRAGLIQMEKRGKFVLCSARTDTLGELVQVLGGKSCCE